jgi:hypothetical protein
VYEPLDSFTLTALTAVLDTLVALEEEQKQRDGQGTPGCASSAETGSG